MKKIALVLIAVFGLSGCVTDEPVAKSTVTASETAQPTQEETSDPEAGQEALDNLFAAELAASLWFSFDNFQCWEGNDCKVIYQLEYLGSRNRHQFSELSFQEVSGYISSSSGSKAKTNVIAIQDSGALAWGYIEPGVTYTVIINTDSKLNDEYDSIYLESHGAVILEDYFGCFKSEPRLVSSTPTC